MPPNTANWLCAQLALSLPSMSVQPSCEGCGLPTRQVPLPPATWLSWYLVLSPPSQNLSSRPARLTRLTWFATEVCTCRSASLVPAGAVPMSRPKSVSVPP
ncbi:hypothetical protein D3C71_1052740 [compost metagenome]